MTNPNLGVADGTVNIDDLDGARIVRDISNLDAVIQEVEPDTRDEDDGGGTVYLAPPETPDDATRPNTHFPDGVDNGNGRTVGVLGRTSVTVKGLTSPEFKRGPMQGGGQNPIIIDARDLPEGTATANGGDPRDWPAVLAQRPKIDGGQERAVGSQFRNIAIKGRGKRLHGYYARNCDKGVVAGVNVENTLGFAFGWSGAFSMHAYRCGSENCGSVAEGQDFGGAPFGTSEQNSLLTPGVPAVYAQEGQDTLSRNVNVKLQGFFQGSDGDDVPTQVLTGPGGTFKLVGDGKYRNGSVIRNATTNTVVRAVVDIAGNIVKDWSITGGSSGNQNILGAHIENDTEIDNFTVEKLPEGIRFGNNPTQSPPITNLTVQQISSNGGLSGDAIVVDNGGGDGKLPQIESSLFSDIERHVVRYDDGNPGPITLRDCNFDSVGGYLIKENRGNASQDSYKTLTGKANNLDRDASGLTANGVTDVPNELTYVDLPSAFRNYFYDVVSASNGDTVTTNMDIEPDLLTLTTASANVVGHQNITTDVNGNVEFDVILEDGDGNTVGTAEPIHMRLDHASRLGQNRTERTVNS